MADARNVLNFTKPIAVMFMGVLGHVADYDEVRSIVARVMAAVPSGSHLVLWDGTDTSQEQVTAAEDYKDTGAVSYIVRSPEQIARCFEGLDMLEPGLVSLSEWRPDTTEDDAKPVDGYGAVARKPQRPGTTDPMRLGALRRCPAIGRRWQWTTAHWAISCRI